MYSISLTLSMREAKALAALLAKFAVAEDDGISRADLVSVEQRLRKYIPTKRG